LLNTNRNQLVNDLFNRPEIEGQNKKADIKDIREELIKFDTAEQEVMNISNDVIDFPLFRI